MERNKEKGRLAAALESTLTRKSESTLMDKYSEQNKRKGKFVRGRISSRRARTNRINSAVLRLSVWGLIPPRIAEWLLRKWGFRDA